MTNIIQTDPQYWTCRRMYAEIIFLGDNTVGPVAERLRELGFDLEILDWPGEDPTSTITASIVTPLGAFAFYDHVQAIVGPLGGDVIEAGFGAAPPQELGRPRKERKPRSVRYSTDRARSPVRTRAAGEGREHHLPAVLWPGQSHDRHASTA